MSGLAALRAARAAQQKQAQMVDIQQNHSTSPVKDDLYYRLFPPSGQSRQQQLMLAARQKATRQAEVAEELAKMERDQKVRELLSEHQLYHHSIRRFLTEQTNPVDKNPYTGAISVGQEGAQAVKRDMKLITKEALEALQLARQMNQTKKVKIPTITFLIDNIVLFTFQGVQLILVAFENRKVKLFEADTGHFQFEFAFEDNTLDQFYTTVSKMEGGQQSEHDSHAKSPAAKLSQGGSSKRLLGSARRITSTALGSTSLSPDGQRSSRTGRAFNEETPDEVLLSMVKGDRCKNRFRGSTNRAKSALNDDDDGDDGNQDKKKQRNQVGIKKKTQYEQAYMKRKALRDKGMWKASVPPYTPCENQEDYRPMNVELKEDRAERHHAGFNATIEVSAVDAHSLIDLSRQVSVDRVHNMIQASEVGDFIVDAPTFEQTDKNNQGSDDDDRSSQREKKEEPKIDEKQLKIQQQAEQFKQSKFSGTVKLNSEDLIPDDLLGDFWDQVENFKDASYTNSHLKRKEERRKRTNRDASEMQKTKSLMQRPWRNSHRKQASTSFVETRESFLVAANREPDAQRAADINDLLAESPAISIKKGQMQGKTTQQTKFGSLRPQFEPRAAPRLLSPEAPELRFSSTSKAQGTSVSKAGMTTASRTVAHRRTQSNNFLSVGNNDLSRVVNINLTTGSQPQRSNLKASTAATQGRGQFNSTKRQQSSAKVTMALAADTAEKRTMFSFTQTQQARQANATTMAVHRAKSYADGGRKKPGKNEPLKKYDFYVLGIDPIIVEDKNLKKQEILAGGGNGSTTQPEHPYGLEGVFTYKNDKNWRKYEQHLWAMTKELLEDKERKISDASRLEQIREEVRQLKALNNPLADLAGLKNALGVPPVDTSKPLRSEDKRALIATITEKKRELDNLILILAKKQEFLGQMITEFDQTQRRRSSPPKLAGSKSKIISPKSDNGECESIYAKQSKSKNYFTVHLNRPSEDVNQNADVHLSKEQKELRALQELQKLTRDYMIQIEEARRTLLYAEYPPETKEQKAKRTHVFPKKPNVPLEMDRRAQRMAGSGATRHDSHLDDESKHAKKKKSDAQKKAYPMCMDYYEPESIAIFGLVSREIQIQKLKKTGVHRKFVNIQSLRVEYMITQMCVGQYHDSRYVLLCVGTQGKTDRENNKKSEVVVFKMDPKLDFEVVETWRWQWPEEQITAMCYDKNCGIIVSAFSGALEIYDPKIVNKSLWSNRKFMRRKKNSTKAQAACGPISSVAFSHALDAIAYAGVKGIINVLDQRTKLKSGQVQAHQEEIVLVRYNDSQRQLVSISISGTVGLWDAQRLHNIQIIKNQNNMSQKCISSWFFYEPKGRVLMATSKIFKFDLVTDSEVLVDTRQQNAIARDYLRQMRPELMSTGVIEPEPEQDAVEIKADALRQASKTTFESRRLSRMSVGAASKTPVQRRKSLTEQEWLKTAYNDQSIKDHLSQKQECNGSVLASQLCRLVSIIVDAEKFLCYTVDREMMVRCWCLATGRCLRSYIIETRSDQIKEVNQTNNAVIDEYTGQKACSDKVQMARSDSKCEYLLLSFEEGLVQINLLETGQLLYNNITVEPIKLENEIAQMAFFESQSKYWVAAACWEGRVAFITRKQESQGRKFLNYKKCRSSHKRDVITMDINADGQLVTGSTDNVICFWNQFSATESKKITFPASIATMSKNQTVHYVRYPFPQRRDLILVIMNQGELFMCETQTEKFIKFNSPPVDMSNDGESLMSGDQRGSYMDIQSNRSDDSELIATKNKSSVMSSQKVHQRKQTSKRDAYILAMLHPYPIVEIKDSYLLSCTETGRGQLHRLWYEEDKDVDVRQSGAGAPLKHGDRNAERGISQKATRICDRWPIHFQELGSYLVDSMYANVNYGHWAGNIVFQVKLCVPQRIFMCAQIKGQVTLFSLDNCARLALLNQSASMCQDLSTSLTVFGRHHSQVCNKRLNVSSTGSAWPLNLANIASGSLSRSRIKSSHHATRQSKKHCATVVDSIESVGDPLMLNEDSVFNDQQDEDEVLRDDQSAINGVTNFLQVRKSADGLRIKKEQQSRSKGSFMQTAASTQFRQ